MDAKTRKPWWFNTAATGTTWEDIWRRLSALFDRRLQSQSPENILKTQPKATNCFLEKNYSD
jgi:hypothetical protein